MPKLALALGVLVLMTAFPALGQESPLQVVMDGRAAAETSELTEAGMSGLAQSAANVVLYVCGALAIALAALGLMELYAASNPDSNFSPASQRATHSGGMWKIIIAGLVSIPAVIAAILPYAVL